MSYRNRWIPYQAVEFKASLTQAFKALRKEGYWARQNWKCCQSCGWAAVPEEKSDKAIFYHAQDAQHIRGREPEVMLAWSGDGDRIADILKEFVKVEWDGSVNTRIQCSPLEGVAS